MLSCDPSLSETEESFGTCPSCPMGAGLASPGDRDRRRWNMLEAHSRASVQSVRA